MPEAQEGSRGILTREDFAGLGSHADALLRRGGDGVDVGEEVGKEKRSIVTGESTTGKAELLARGDLRPRAAEKKNAIYEMERAQRGKERRGVLFAWWIRQRRMKRYRFLNFPYLPGGKHIKKHGAYTGTWF